MRVFIALNLPNDILLKLSYLQELLKETQANVLWVKPTNLHITLRFLGESDENLLKEACLAVRKTAKINNCFTASLAELGVFPDARKPHIIWVGLKKGKDQIKLLAASLDETLKEFGLAQENHEFSAHITIGRIKSGLNFKTLTEKITSLRLYFADTPTHFKIDKITLFRSKLAAGGAVYEALEDENLKIS